MTVPERYQSPEVRTLPSFMPEEWVQELGAWLYDHRDRLLRAGDPSGEHTFGWSIAGIDIVAPELVAPFRRALLEAVKPAGPVDVDITALMLHHDCRVGWHHDDVATDTAFDFTFCALPRMFEGGELEFLAGDAIEPKNNQLALFSHAAQRRVRQVRCYSASAVSARWALTGSVMAARRAVAPSDPDERAQRARLATPATEPDPD